LNSLAMTTSRNQKSTFRGNVKNTNKSVFLQKSKEYELAVSHACKLSFLSIALQVKRKLAQAMIILEKKHRQLLRIEDAFSCNYVISKDK